MEKHPVFKTTLTSCFHGSAGRSLTVSTSSKCLVTQRKNPQAMQDFPGSELRASRPCCGCASSLGLDFIIIILLLLLGWGVGGRRGRLGL